VDYFNYTLKYKGTYSSLDGVDVKFSIWDLAGADVFKKITRGYLPLTQGLILVFNLNDPESFTKLDEWLEDAMVYISFSKEENIQLPGVVIGNKKDLPQLVPSSEAQEWAFKRGFTYFEVSAKTDHLNIKNAINDFFKTMIETYHDQIHRKIKHTYHPTTPKNNECILL
jgi:GTPase SAR1 family protein